MGWHLSQQRRWSSGRHLYLEGAAERYLRPSAQLPWHCECGEVITLIVSVKENPRSDMYLGDFLLLLTSSYSLLPLTPYFLLLLTSSYSLLPLLLIHQPVHVADCVFVIGFVLK